MSDTTETLEGQTILEHLKELRIRLTWILGFLVVGTAISFIFASQLLEFITSPAQTTLQLLGPTESIEIYFKVALVSGAVLAMPFIMHQVWLFVEPALQRSEKRYAVLFIFSATFLFLTGIVFSWYVLLPPALTFLREFQQDVFKADWTASEYTSFTTTFLFWIGVSFQLPLVVYLVSRAGLLGPKTLREQWRVAIVTIAVIAAAVTPSIDPVTMLLTMAPLTVLYVLSIGLSALGQRQFERVTAIE